MVTLLFPGQGSQYVGMGSKLKDDPEAYEYFAKADEVLGYSLSNICLEGPAEELKLTANTQPAILTHSIALFSQVKKKLDNKKIKIGQVLGHSVGEYAALVAAGVLSFEDAVKAVNLRGKYMQDAVPVGVGKMYAILRLNDEIVEKACEAASQNDSVVTIANYNSSAQVVISGHGEACERAIKWLEENSGEKRIRAMELPVSAPFHSPLMKPAEINMTKHLNNITFKENIIPYTANINAQTYPIGTTGDLIRKNLIDQISGAVKWKQSIDQLPSDTICLEVGPGKVLAGLVKKINPELKVISLDDENGLEQLNEVLS